MHLDDLVHHNKAFIRELHSVIDVYFDTLANEVIPGDHPDCKLLQDFLFDYVHNDTDSRDFWDYLTAHNREDLAEAWDQLTKAK